MLGVAGVEGARDCPPLGVPNVLNDLIAQRPFAEGRKPLSQVDHATSGAGVARPERIDVAEQVLID